MARYEGKRAVVTGATSGIGLATAKALVEGGARVLATGRTPASLETARSVLGAGAVVIDSDAVTGIGDLAGRAAAEFGAVDLLVLNAGTNLLAPVLDTTPTDYDNLFELNTKAPFFTVQAFVPLMPAGSAIVITTSVADVKGLAGLSVYAATKAALRSMTRSFAVELVDRGIRCNAVSPGPIDTGILRRSMSDEQARETLGQMAARNPMRRVGAPEEVASAILFLGFDATYTTGTEFAVDGGASQL